MPDNLDQNSFTPVHGAHAIVEAIAFVKVAPKFPEKDIRRIIDLQSALKDELPKFDISKKYEALFTQDKEGVTTTSQTRGTEIGIEAQRVKSDASVEWLLRTNENTIGMHCLDYQRWNDFIERVLKIFSVVINKIKSTESAVSSVGLKVIDNFLYEGQVESYASDKLFRSNDYLANHCFKVGEMWHCHTGWFEELRLNDTQVLNQLNVGALYKNIEGKKTHVTSIEHNALIKCESKKLNNLYDLINPENSPSYLRAYLTELHRINKKVLLSLLNPDMAKRINLQPSQ
jgi:uncharacterized protein (TIGR04255 family)